MFPLHDGAIPVVDPTAADGVFSLLWLVDRAAGRRAPRSC